MATDVRNGHIAVDDIAVFPEPQSSHATSVDNEATQALTSSGRYRSRRPTRRPADPAPVPARNRQSALARRGSTRRRRPPHGGPRPRDERHRPPPDGSLPRPPKVEGARPRGSWSGNTVMVAPLDVRDEYARRGPLFGPWAVEFALLLSLGPGSGPSPSLPSHSMSFARRRRHGLSWPAQRRSTSRTPWKGSICRAYCVVRQSSWDPCPFTNSGLALPPDNVAYGLQAQLDLWLTCMVAAAARSTIPVSGATSTGSRSGVHPALGGEVFHGGPGIGLGCVQQAGPGEPLGQVPGPAHRSAMVWVAAPRSARPRCLSRVSFPWVSISVLMSPRTLNRSRLAAAKPTLGRARVVSAARWASVARAALAASTRASRGWRLGRAGRHRVRRLAVRWSRHKGGCSGSPRSAGHRWRGRRGRPRPGCDLPVVQVGFEPVVEGRRMAQWSDGAQPVQAGEVMSGLVIVSRTRSAYWATASGRLASAVGAAPDRVAGGDQADGQELAGGGRGFAGPVQHGLSAWCAPCSRSASAPRVTPSRVMGWGSAGSPGVRSGRVSRSRAWRA